MQIKQPLCITSRLLPGIEIGEGVISIEYASHTVDGRQRYQWYVDLNRPFDPEWEKEFQGDDLKSGVGGGSLQEGLESLLGFLNAFAEAREYEDRTGRVSEHSELFPAGLVSWAVANTDEFSLLANELQEKPGEFIVE